MSLIKSSSKLSQQNLENYHDESYNLDKLFKEETNLKRVKNNV